jgi:transcriptional regulator with XRE-family HTH domain
VNDLLVLLGKRVHELRGAKKWSQEEFAHISGLHRTYIGQIELGEKNISFGNLSKIAGVLGGDPYPSCCPVWKTASRCRRKRKPEVRSPLTLPTGSAKFRS